MKLAAIIHAWGDTLCLLPYCINNMVPLADEVIVVWSSTSNYGEIDTEMQFFAENYRSKHTSFVRWEPHYGMPPQSNEREKRNYGLSIAKQSGCTHFLNLDADEVYEPEPFLKEKERFKNPDLQGLVCASQVYFKSPQLTIGLDTTRVTFIHKITPQLKFEWNKSFPFAWDKMALRIDPTRQLNINAGVEWSNIICHHYSWCRSDFEKKIRNSTARANLEKSSIREDLLLAKPGYFCKFYQKTLMPASVDFKIPDFNVHEDIQPLASTGD